MFRKSLSIPGFQVFQVCCHPVQCTAHSGLLSYSYSKLTTFNYKLWHDIPFYNPLLLWCIFVNAYTVTRIIVCKIVVTCKTKHLQNICKYVLVFFIFHITISKNVLQVFYAKTFAKTLQNICKTFLQTFQHVEHMLKTEGGYT